MDTNKKIEFYKRIRDSLKENAMYSRGDADYCDLMINFNALYSLKRPLVELKAFTLCTLGNIVNIKVNRLEKKKNR